MTREERSELSRRLWERPEFRERQRQGLNRSHRARMEARRRDPDWSQADADAITRIFEELSE